MSTSKTYSPIGIFDSGYGGLTVMKEIVKELPQYDYLYLGDNARAPYGTRSFETVYQYTLECVNHLFAKGCHLVILACNTASAKALRNIQQKDLPNIDPSRRVLGVIRPTTEVVGNFSKTKHVGVLGTTGTVTSNSYPIEIEKFFPEVKVFQEACPMWVPLIENNEFNNEGSNYFVEQHIKNLLRQSDKIDTVILGCTHYPLLLNKIKQYLPQHITILSQGEIVSKGLSDYLKRHPEMDAKCSKGGSLKFFTTEMPHNFDEQASRFFGKEIKSEHLQL
ncbi:MAG: glutamate racemase [Bacteroidetes bacterium]|nr:glutamate racemase [Bacteroidota bacterium]